MLYKYPQARLPVRAIWWTTNRRRGAHELEYELLDTGVFDEDRYFDVFVEYAKADAEDILIRITVAQPRSGAGDAPPAADAVVPQHLERGTRSAASRADARWTARGHRGATHPSSGDCAALLRRRRPAAVHARTRPTTSASSARDNATPYVEGRVPRVSSCTAARGGEPARHRHEGRRRTTAGGTGRRQSVRVRLRLTGAGRWPTRSARASTRRSTRGCARPTSSTRTITPPTVDRRRARASCARRWPACCGPSSTTTSTSTAGWRSTRRTRCRRATGRPQPAVVPREQRPTSSRCPTSGSTPGTPRWDLAFHCLPMAMIDPEFAKSQLVLLTREWYMHPSGQFAGLRVGPAATSTRRCTPGRRSSCTASTRRSAEPRRDKQSKNSQFSLTPSTCILLVTDRYLL